MLSPPQYKLVGPILELTPVLKNNVPFCPNPEVLDIVCDCPDGHVSVGYQGLLGPGYDSEVVNSFQLVCRELNLDGTLGSQSVTSRNGAVPSGTSTPVGPELAINNEVLIGLEPRIGCGLDFIEGRSVSVDDAVDGNQTANIVNSIGGSTGGEPRPEQLVPPGHVMTGMRAYVDENPICCNAEPGITAGYAIRYRKIVRE